MAVLSVIILTKNEEENIAPAVQNARQCADDVLVVDSGSTDATVELAEKNGARVVFRAWDNDFSAQRNFALTQTNAEWVLYLDADERMDASFIASVLNLVKKKAPIQGVMTRKVVAFGHTFRHGIFTPDKVPRLFPAAQVRWENKVHERPVCDLPETDIGGCVMHYTYQGWHQWVQKINDYTSIWARDSYKKGRRTSALSALLHALFGFIKAYVLQLGFLDGWMGLFSSWQHACYTLLKYVKLLDEQRRNIHG